MGITVFGIAGPGIPEVFGKGTEAQSNTGLSAAWRKNSFHYC